MVDARAACPSRPVWQARGKFRHIDRASDPRRTLAAVACPDSTDEPELVRSLARGREALGRIGLRLTAGFTTSEIVDLIEAERDELEHLELPRYGRPVTRAWIAAQLKDLREELVEVS